MDLELSDRPRELAFQLWERKAEVALRHEHLNLWAQCLDEMPDVVVDPEELILDMFQRVWKVSPPSPKRLTEFLTPQLLDTLSHEMCWERLALPPEETVPILQDALVEELSRRSAKGEGWLDTSGPTILSALRRLIQHQPEAAFRLIEIGQTDWATRGFDLHLLFETAVEAEQQALAKKLWPLCSPRSLSEQLWVGRMWLQVSSRRWVPVLEDMATHAWSSKDRLDIWFNYVCRFELTSVAGNLLRGFSPADWKQLKRDSSPENVGFLDEALTHPATVGLPALASVRADVLAWARQDPDFRPMPLLEAWDRGQARLRHLEVQSGAQPVSRQRLRG